MESDCFVHVIKYIVPNDNLYVVSQCTLMNLAEFILSQFTFFSAKKNSNLFTTKMLGVSPFEKVEVDLYDLHSSKSQFGSKEEIRQHNTHIYQMVSH